MNEPNRELTVVEYQQPEEEVHSLLFLPEDATFQERKNALAIYTKVKGGISTAIDEYLNKPLKMVGLFQHRIRPRTARIDKVTGLVLKPAKDGWVRTVIFIEGLEKPFSLGSEPVAETASDIISVLGKQGMFPDGEHIDIEIQTRGKRPDQYYVLIVLEDK